MNQDNEEKLSQVLKRWEVSAEAPRTLRSSVWSQIAVRQEVRDNSPWSRFLRLFLEGLAKPAYAGMIAAVALMLGVGLAHFHSSVVSNQRVAAAKSEYFSSISPLDRIGGNGNAHGH